MRIKLSRIRDKRIYENFQKEVKAIGDDALYTYVMQILLTEQSTIENYTLHIRALQEQYISFIYPDPRPNHFTITDKGRAFLEKYNTNLTMSSI